MKQAEGFWGQRKNVFKRARETLLRAWAYAFKSRKLRKRDMRKLWIIQLGNAVKAEGLSYSKFIHQLSTHNIKLDRKILADLAVNHIEDFKKVVAEVK